MSQTEGLADSVRELRAEFPVSRDGVRNLKIERVCNEVG